MSRRGPRATTVRANPSRRRKTSTKKFRSDDPYPLRGWPHCLRQLEMNVRYHDNPVLTAALGLAAAGVPGFPCLSDKRPACHGGFKAATTDPEKLREVWQQYAGPLIGVPIGH